jgi:hypothetical protein
MGRSKKKKQKKESTGEDGKNYHRTRITNAPPSLNDPPSEYLAHRNLTILRADFSPLFQHTQPIKPSFYQRTLQNNTYSTKYSLCPSVEKYFGRRFQLLSKFNHGAVLDEESWFSITPEGIAAHVANKCKDALARHGKPADPDAPFDFATAPIVVDGFCGVGGNVIQFARAGFLVVAVDIDWHKLQYAYHNASLYGVQDRILFLHGDFAALAPRLRADAILVCPPWGGVAYQSESLQAFSLEDDMPMNGLGLYRHALQVSANIMYFLPRKTPKPHLAALAGLPPCRCDGHCLLRRRDGSNRPRPNAPVLAADKHNDKHADEHVDEQVPAAAEGVPAPTRVIACRPQEAGDGADADADAASPGSAPVASPRLPARGYMECVVASPVAWVDARGVLRVRDCLAHAARVARSLAEGSSAHGGDEAGPTADTTALPPAAEAPGSEAGEAETGVDAAPPQSLAELSARRVVVHLHAPTGAAAAPGDHLGSDARCRSYDCCAFQDNPAWAPADAEQTKRVLKQQREAAKKAAEPAPDASVPPAAESGSDAQATSEADIKTETTAASEAEAQPSMEDAPPAEAEDVAEADAAAAAPAEAAPAVAREAWSVDTRPLDALVKHRLRGRGVGTSTVLREMMKAPELFDVPALEAGDDQDRAAAAFSAVSSTFLRPERSVGRVRILDDAPVASIARGLIRVHKNDRKKRAKASGAGIVAMLDDEGSHVPAEPPAASGEQAVPVHAYPQYVDVLLWRLLHGGLATLAGRFWQACLPTRLAAHEAAAAAAENAAAAAAAAAESASTEAVDLENPSAAEASAEAEASAPASTADEAGVLSEEPAAPPAMLEVLSLPGRMPHSAPRPVECVSRLGIDIRAHISALALFCVVLKRVYPDLLDVLVRGLLPDSCPALPGGAARCSPATRSSPPSTPTHTPSAAHSFTSPPARTATAPSCSRGGTDSSNSPWRRGSRQPRLRSPRRPRRAARSWWCPRRWRRPSPATPTTTPPPRSPRRPPRRGRGAWWRSRPARRTAPSRRSWRGMASWRGRPRPACTRGESVTGSKTKRRL